MSNTNTPPEGDAQQLRCRKCGSPACLTLVRAAIPPVNVIDLIDWQFKLMLSGHWSWDHVGYFAVVAVIAAVVIVLLAASSPGWALALALALAVGGGGGGGGGGLLTQTVHDLTPAGSGMRSVGQVAA